MALRMKWTRQRCQLVARTFFAAALRPSWLPSTLAPLLAWSQTEIDPRLNALLLNWYDGTLGHYIGAHRDDEKELIEGAPIITISFGDSRTFRLRRWRTKETFIDIVVTDGSVLVLPYTTNMTFTHQVPKSTRQTGKRIDPAAKLIEHAATSSLVLLCH